MAYFVNAPFVIDLGLRLYMLVQVLPLSPNHLSVTHLYHFKEGESKEKDLSV